MPWQQSPPIVRGLTHERQEATAMADVQAPAGYEYLPQLLLATLRRSYDEKAPDNQNLANSMGFAPGAKTAKDMSFKETLDGLNIPDQNGDTLLGVISAIYKRCTKEPALWQKIHAIRNVWTYRAGNNVSQGMMWTATNADATMALAHASPHFCTDSLAMSADHQKDTSKRWCLRTCYREIVPGGTEGLHVCVVMPSYRGQDPWGGEHDIHIDRHQLGCKKHRANPHITLQAPDCGCVYSLSGLAGHAKDVVPYFLRKFGVIN
jgi:hypothetical protein